MQNHEIYNKLGYNLIIIIVVEAVDSLGNSVGYKTLHENWHILSDVTFEQYFHEVQAKLNTMSDDKGYSLNIF